MAKKRSASSRSRKQRTTPARSTAARGAKRRSAKRPTTARSATRGAAASAARLADEAQFVFKGTVVQRGAATLDEVPLTREATIVRVNEILNGPPVLAGFAGADITVQLERGQKANAGESYVFYTNGWIYGAGLAVKCVALTPETEADVRVSRQAVETGPERALRARADRAELVVTGHVTEITEAPRPTRAPITEHDPEWRRAVIAVDDVPGATGRAATRKPRKVVIRFAASPDVRWASAPKFVVGDAGVWFLGDKKMSRDAEAVRTAAGAAEDEFVVVDPEDYLPLEFADRVSTILNR